MADGQLTLVMEPAANHAVLAQKVARDLAVILRLFTVGRIAPAKQRKQSLVIQVHVRVSMSGV